MKYKAWECPTCGAWQGGRGAIRAQWAAWCDGACSHPKTQMVEVTLVREEAAASERLYVLVATAVYDHGVIGVYSSEQLAKDAAEEIWVNTDGHHVFRIVVVEPDKTYENVFEYTMWEQSAEKLAKRRSGRTVVAEIERRP